jgi:Haem-degrading
MLSRCGHWRIPVRFRWETTPGRTPMPTPSTVAVLDAAGQLVASAREGGASPLRERFAGSKALGALITARSESAQTLSG